MRKYILKYKGWLALTVFFRCFGAGMQVAIALILKEMIDRATEKDLSGFVKVFIFSCNWY